MHESGATSRRSTLSAPATSFAAKCLAGLAIVALVAAIGVIVVAWQRDAVLPWTHMSATPAQALLAALCAGLGGSLIRIRRYRRKLRDVDAQIEDLTDQNWSLRESAERNRSLLEAQGDVIVRRDILGHITYANEAFHHLVGFDGDLVGTSFALEIIQQGESHTLADGTRIYDQKINTPAGARWIAWREVAVRDDSVAGAEIQCVGRDVTERAETEHALLETRNQAEAASRAKSRFLAMVSHEIRTPLNGILGMADLILDTSLTQEQTTYVKAIRTSGDALLSLIEEVLDFSKIEAGKLDIEARPFSISSLVEGLVELLAPRAHAKQLELAYLVDGHLMQPVIGDETRLRQVLLNLVGNAIKFTERGGVAVVVEPGRHPNEIHFRVEDTGIGISPEAQARIFHEFEQEETGRTRRYAGTGLGLAISQRIVERMGGTITLESVPGQGTIFEFTLRLPKSSETDTPTFAAPDLAKSELLMVSSSCFEAPLIAEQAQRWGAKTCVVHDEVVALALLPERAWDVLIVDRPFGPAVEALLQAASQRVPHRILLVSPADRRELPNLNAAGYTGYLVKPVRPASLAARLSDTELVIEPSQSASIAAFEVPRTEPEQRPRGLAILVAEDNEINALLARSLLVKLGHQPTIATNGAIAYDSWLAAHAAGTPYDLVFMDVHMPEVDGVEATVRIRAAEASRDLPRTPIVALTANAFAEDRQTCLAAGMDAFLTKPLDRERLLDALAHIDPIRRSPLWIDELSPSVAQV